MKPKHTPGPWYPVFGRIEIEGNDIADIASFYPRDMGQGHLKRSTEEIIANAKIAAAALPMLDALQNILSMAENPKKDDYMRIAYEARDAINFAIEED